MTRDEIIAMMKEAEVLLEGHFLLTSGRHSDKYMQCAKIFQNAKYSEPLCAELVKQYKDDNVELVIGPAIGAIQMSYEVGKQLGVKNIFAERENGVMTLRRGFTIEKGQRVLIVEDVVTTGGSVREVMELVKESGGEIVGIGSIVDRTGGKIDFGVP
ncbi:MAG: orotate phosphoribosyltransferase, partial [Clostridia bacterium]|nr:orotate phosphoribosyltransferase [Clostridia bacterium]